LRIDVDGAAPGEPYAIPPDNPFADGALGRPELYAWGLRNPWRFSFDAESGALWAGDVGQNQWEEVNLITRGGNYGWAIKEGSACFGADSCDDAGLIDPVAQYRNHAVASVIAGQVYRGAALPELRGAFIYSDFYSGAIWAVREGEEPALLSESGGRQLTSWAREEDGELLGVRFDGALLRLVAAPPPADEGLPETLSTTGCFDMAASTGAPAGALPYELNVPFWSDGASKRRWLSTPADATVAIAPDGDWQLPIGSVLVKTFELAGAPVETRLLIRHDDGGWAGYSYAWDADGREATLLDRGETRALEGDAGTQSWTFPSRGECDFCHSAAAGYTLGLESAQLARDVTGPDGQVVDQLEALGERLLLVPAPQDPAPLPTADGDAPLEQRARAYLHANCSQCHRPDGPGGRARVDLRYTTPLSEALLCDEPPRAGDLDIPDARLLAPGDPARSLLSARVRSLGTTRMPPVGSTRVDEEGAALLDAWIASLDACPE
ncbi:MAG: PQQ-dependent sugar dehydrogenase, partial [Myxococcales bacterium]|nr:PQQ-dependent sugar dehydrogenase [Myxococcales bacterium]